MHRRTFLQLSTLGLALSATRSRANDADPDEQTKLADLLRSVREKHQVPGMAAALIRDGRVVATAVAGVRHVDEPDPIAINDRFGIGSCTKRMTATMIARVIDTGKLSFDATLADLLPDLKMRDVYRNVTVAQLLTFTGGLQPWMRFDAADAGAILGGFRGLPSEQRLAFAAHVLQEEPAAQPGTRRVYSNASYAVVGALAEQQTGRDWEDLMTEHVFRPLEMTRAGFGRPRTADRPDEPTLHSNGLPPGRSGATGSSSASAVGEPPENKPPYRPEPPDRDRTLALHAAGAVHCPIGDFCRFILYELNHAAGENSLLTDATAARMRDLFPRRGGDPIRAAIRGGSAWLSAGYALWPDQHAAAAALVNAGGAAPACDDIFEAARADL